MFKKNDMLGSLIRALVGVPKHMLGLMLDIANRLNSSQNEKFYEALTIFLRNWKRDTVLYFQRLFEDENIEIRATGFDDRIINAGGIFTGGIDPAFKYRNVGRETTTTVVTICELVRDGTFADIYGSLGKDLNELCSTQGQIVAFCESNKDKLYRKGGGTYFLYTYDDDPIQEINDDVRVAYVYATEIDGGHFVLSIVTRYFSDKDIHEADGLYRFVFPEIKRLTT